MTAKTEYSERPKTREVVAAPGGAIAYFRENIEEAQTTDAEGNTQTGYTADEYPVFIRSPLAIAKKRVNAKPSAWLAKAKEEFADRQAVEETAAAGTTEAMLLELAADHEERICMIELLNGEEE